VRRPGVLRMGMPYPWPMLLQFPTTHPLNVARTQVSLPTGSFIRALPFAVDETQRFRIDALVGCADIAASAYVQMIEMALRSKVAHSEGLDVAARHVDIAMFQHAWSIVDQIYSLRLLLKSLDFTGEDVDAFMASTARAHVLRNRMDHLDSRIPNIAASKSQSRSLFGSLSYFVLGAAVGAPEVDVFLVIQQAEPIRPAEQIGSARFPADMRMPIGNFVLGAAGEMLDLDAAILALGPVLTRTNEGFERSITAQITEAAAEHGIEEGVLLAHQGAGYKLMFALKAGQTNIDTEAAGKIDGQEASHHDVASGGDVVASKNDRLRTASVGLSIK
jgi:hypothetical protein